MENRIKKYGETVKDEIAKINSEMDTLGNKKRKLWEDAVASKKKEFVGAVFYKDYNEDKYECYDTNYEYCKVLSVSDYGDFLRVLSIRKFGRDHFSISYDTKSLYNFEYWDECTKKEFDSLLNEAKAVLNKKK